LAYRVLIRSGHPGCSGAAKCSVQNKRDPRSIGPETAPPLSARARVYSHAVARAWQHRKDRFARSGREGTRDGSRAPPQLRRRGGKRDIARATHEKTQVGKSKVFVFFDSRRKCVTRHLISRIAVYVLKTIIHHARTQRRTMR